ncbi:MAG: Stp1/IreP family PP2C-type Ser/Thr phosphatase [Myxococcota bacterium]|nr:Stp1/IreP family PP2C-type Ser/Thr phosphatase [Myxococcota bacterium]
MFYIASNDRPDNAHKYCWDCGFTDTPQSESHCIKCGAQMRIRKFLLSSRWKHEAFQGFEQFFNKELHHGSMLSPLDMFYEEGVMWSLVEWTGQDFMLNKCAPLQAAQILNLAQRIAGLLAYFHYNGIALEEVHARNFLYDAQQDDFVFFDPDIRVIYDQPVPEAERGLELPTLAQVLLDLTSVSDHQLRTLLLNTMEGSYASPYEFGRAIEKFMSKGIQPTKMLDNIAAISDVGLVRNLNEDNWGWTNLNEELNLFVVADGMGGHDCGEIASQMAVDVICEEAYSRINGTQELSLGALEKLLENSFQQANNSIKTYSEKVGSDMGTTMVAGLFLERHGQKFAMIANVGDSRAYLFRNNVLHQISKDHSLVAKMVESKQLTKEEARVHPHSNILLRTVGTEKNVNIDIFRIALERSDLVLLCSDGLWGEVEDTDLQDVIAQSSDLHKACRGLLRSSHLGGGKDNCTIMLIRV